MARILVLSSIVLVAAGALFLGRTATSATGDIVASLTLPDGTTVVTTPFVVSDVDGVTIRGGKGTRIVYRGPPTAGVFQFRRAYRATLRDVEIVVDAADVDAAVLLTNLPGSNAETGRISSAIAVSNVRVMHGGVPTAARRAFSIDSYAAGGPDGNNDHHTFVHCLAQSYTEVGFYIKGSQCHHLVFDRCFAADAIKRGGIGLHAEEGVYFAYRDGGMNSNGIDFKLGRAEIQAVIDNFDSENSKQFLVTARTGGETFVNVSNVRWDGRPVAGTPVIDAFGPGPYAFANSYFSGINGVCPTVRFDGNASSGGKPSVGYLDVRGVMIRQHLGTMPTGSVITAPAGWSYQIHGLRYQRIGSDTTRTNRTIKLNGPLG